MSNYYVAVDKDGNYILAHAGKWRQHKYIRKEGNRYIYPEDLRRGRATDAVARGIGAANSRSSSDLTVRKGGRRIANGNPSSTDLGRKYHDERGMRMTREWASTHRGYSRSNSDIKRIYTAQETKKRIKQTVNPQHDRHFDKDDPSYVGNMKKHIASNSVASTAKKPSSTAKGQSAVEKFLQSASKAASSAVSKGKDLLSRLFGKRK